MRVGYLGGWDHDAMRSSLPPEVWDPFYPFPAIQAEAYAEAAFELWRETAEAHVLTAHMPGARKVEVEVGGMLKVSGERRSEKFERRFRLPEDGRVAELKATMGKYGVLTVTVPKVEVNYRVIPIV